MIDRHLYLHPASRAFSYSTYALYREKAPHESCQVLVEHAQRVAKIQFRTQAIHISRGYSRPVNFAVMFFRGLSFGHRLLVKVDARTRKTSLTAVNRND